MTAFVRWLRGWAALENELATFCGAPKSVNVHHVGSDTGDGDFKKPLALGGFEELPFLLGEAMSNPTASNFGACWLATAETLDVIFVRFWHDGRFKKF